MSAARITSAWIEACASSFASRFAPSPLTSASNNCAPSPAMRRAQAAPMPLAAPVMSAWIPFSRFSHLTRLPNLLARLVDDATRVGPILEGAEIVDLRVAHVLEHLAAQGRAPARGAIHDDGFILRKILVVVRRFGIGAKLQHAARDIDRADNFAALLDFRGVAHADHQRVAFA